jgi:predicted metal-dependent peptidase
MLFNIACDIVVNSNILLSHEMNLQSITLKDYGESIEMIAVAYSEIKGGIEQFDGKLKGWLGFFDAAIIEHKPFEDLSDLRKIKPAGGGGTDFRIIFEYVHRYIAENPPSSIIILTDGNAPFP